MTEDFDRLKAQKDAILSKRSSRFTPEWCENMARLEGDAAKVYAWLGYWRDQMPAEAVSQLQGILGLLKGNAKP